MTTNKLLQRITGLALAVLLLAGCGGAPTEPTPKATPIPPATSQPEPEAERIRFAPGATSAQVQGTLAADGSDRYVLYAMAGQEMTVNLSDSSAGVNAILVIWGADGTVLISDHADATTWVGELPHTQDYYIAVNSVAQAPVDYVLEVIIPAATSGAREVPPTIQPVLARLESTGVPWYTC